MEPESKKHSIVLTAVVTQYLESHKRLVIPQFGAFIVKEPGHGVLFSELLKRDDGVLRGLLRARGLGDLEAAGEIDRFVFEVRHAVERGAEYRMSGFGVLKPGPNGTIAFVYEPQATPAESSSASEVSDGAAAPGAPAESARTGSRTQHVHSERVAEAVRTAFSEPRVSRSAKMDPDPSVRGLRYGKPPKNTDAYTYVDRAPRRRTDRFVWIAVIAAVLALAAIAFGLWHDARKQQAETEYIELPAVPQSDTSASAVQPEQRESEE